MSHQMQRYRNENIGPQEEWGNQHNPHAQCHPPPVNFFQGEIQRLNALLEMEREKWFKENQKVAYLQTELAETQFQWRRQKSLKEMYINKEKETKSKLERIDRFSDPATLDPAVIASKVHNDMKYKKKKLLQKDFEEIKVALILNQEAFTSQIQAEKEKNNVLQEELDKLKTSYEELCSKCEVDVAAGRQQAQVQTFCEEKIGEDPQLLEKLRAAKDDLHQKMSQEIVFLKEKEEHLESELEQVKDFHQELLGVYERDVAKLKEEVETYQKELNHEKTANSHRAMKDVHLIKKLRHDNTYLYSTMSEKIEILQRQLEETENHLDQNEKDNSALRQRVKNFQQQIIQEKKAHLKTAKTDLTLLNSMRTEQDDLKENMSKVIAFLQERENGFQRELDQIKVSYQELNCKYEKEVSVLKQQVDTYQKHLDREKKS
ncbi:putative WEB family protein At1g65010, chloroplastic [Girardinichthys multiradiatus]|uniref:putative WEB family protein At1g65010, chloroplastic n=1 Tax=Girardinichthys multiradiatus TaxID=208333 RepID=UPI001FAC0C87|nr:putative WEB family protein At1g65010, chloroplastic [Girardinichthys multiradiatus]